MVIVDTSVWVHFFRSRGSPEHREVDRLLTREEVVMVGPIMAEILQGARSIEEFDQLRIRLAALPYVEATLETWSRSGALSYQLRQQGNTIGLVDLLISALALEHGHRIYSRDEHFERVPELELYEPG